MGAHVVALAGALRPEPPRRAGAAARAPAPRGRARRAPRHQPARHLQAPQGAARGGARPGPPGGQPARLRARPRPDPRARRLARPLPAAVEREPRRARPPPRPEGLIMYGTYETYDGKPAVRFERVYPHPVERVWRSITVPEELSSWFPSTGELSCCSPTTVEVALREGGAMHFSFAAHAEPMNGRVVELDPPKVFA